MVFRIKNIEELEDKEKWENIFFHQPLQFGTLVSYISELYEKINLDNSLWRKIKYKDEQGVFTAEKNWKWISNKLMPDLERGIKEINKQKSEKRLFEWKKKILEEILKVARTCVKYKKNLVITI